jgi:hypothetical protein
MADDRYLRLLNIGSAKDAHREIKKLASDLTDDEHAIRSCIFDLHAAVETELRRVYYHLFKNMLFLTDDEKKNAETEKAFSMMIERLSFTDMHRVLRPILNSWPYPELAYIDDINLARNRAAHGGSLDKLEYQGRNPFKDPDCFAQMYFDVWAITQSMAKFFDWTISMPREKAKRYYKKFGDI